MITVKEAKERIIATAGLLDTVSVELGEAAGYVLAADIPAPVSLPSFRQSSMDGYALIHSDVTAYGTTLKLTGESRAGQGIPELIAEGSAVRIFTGAPVPENATAVVMQENTEVENNSVFVREFPVPEGKNIRRIGQQIAAGAVALQSGTLLSPGSIGFLSGMNVSEVTVYKKPKVGLLLTGDELLRAGEPPEFGKVYESNSAMLVAALKNEGIGDVEILYAKDDLPSTIAALEKLIGGNDLVLASGGISVGDYDYVGVAMEAVGAQTVFYKVRQKPGKPLFFAVKDEKLLFALPGNPASSLVCYYEYVLPAIRKMTGRSDPFLKVLRLPSRYAYSFDGARDEFLKAIVDGEEVIPLDGQESFALRSFAVANALIYLPADQHTVKEGDLVEVHLLPF